MREGLANCWARGSCDPLGQRLAGHDQGNVVYQRLDISRRGVL